MVNGVCDDDYMEASGDDRLRSRFSVCTPSDSRRRRRSRAAHRPILPNRCAIDDRQLRLAPFRPLHNRQSRPVDWLASQRLDGAMWWPDCAARRRERDAPLARLSVALPADCKLRLAVATARWPRDSRQVREATWPQRPASWQFADSIR